MREIKTVALIGLGAIGSFLASNLHGVLGENLRIVAGGARKERLERDGIVVNGVPFISGWSRRRRKPGTRIWRL